MRSNTRKLLLLSGGAGIFAQANPQTGTLYAGTSDGVFVWTLSYPASPDYLDQLRGGWRVQDLQSGGLGLVNNGWEWRLEYQTNGTWTFTWYSVASGTAAAAIYTQTNIGTVTNIRVKLVGTSITVESSADGGVNYTARGNTTSATYQTNTNISASYTGLSGSPVFQDLFNSWSGGNPVGWTVDGESGSDPAVKEVGSGENNTGAGTGAANFYSSATINLPLMYKMGVLTVGQTYVGVIPVSFITSTQRIAISSTANNATATGDVALRGKATGTDISTRILAANGNNTIDSFTVWLVGVLDGSGDGGFSVVRAI